MSVTQNDHTSGQGNKGTHRNIDSDAWAYLPRILELYLRQHTVRKWEYLGAHSHQPELIVSAIRTVLRYMPYVKGTRILDWGCFHGLDSCVLRLEMGDKVEITGADVLEEVPAKAFCDFSRMRYTYLSHPYRLPFGDAEFDTVVASASLEHCAMPSESLEKLHRVIKNGGNLIVTGAPSRYSITEMLQDWLHLYPHSRRYTRSSLKRLLLDHGFQVVSVGFHEIIQTFSSPAAMGLRKMPLCRWMLKGLHKICPLLDKLWPVNLLGQNIYVIGRRSVGIQ